MTREEAIEILIAEAVCASPILSCDFCARCLGPGTDCTHPTDKEIEEAVLLLKGASKKMAISALRKQEQESSDWICTLKCTALMEEGMCSHGGLCCLYESQRTIKENEPLTLDELRKMDGEPVWLHTFSPVQKKTNVAQWSILETVGSANATFLRAGVNSRLTKWFCNYGERWLAYRRNPEEGEK